MSEPKFTISEINDGGNPEYDIDTVTVRCRNAGVDTEISMTDYTGSYTARRFSFMSTPSDAGDLYGIPCQAEKWNEILKEFEAHVKPLPGLSVQT